MTQADHQQQVGKDISVHHLVPRKFFVGPDGRFYHDQANRVSNLVTVCSKHHLIWEAVAPQRLDTIVDTTQSQEVSKAESGALSPRGGEGNAPVVQMQETDESIPTPNADDPTSKEQLHWHLTSALASAESAKTKAHLRGALAEYRNVPPTPLVECPFCGKVGLPERIRTHECR